MAITVFRPFKKLIRDQRRIRVFLLSVAVSILLWFLISLRFTYSIDLSIPVVAANVPAGRMMTAPFPDAINALVSGTGFDLIRLQRNMNSETLVLNLNALRYTASGAEMRAALDASFFTNALAEQVSSRLKVESIQKDSLDIVLVPRMNKKVPLRCVFEVPLEKGYAVTEVSIVPDHIELTGPSTILDTMTAFPLPVVSDTALRSHVRLVLPVQASAAGFGVTSSLSEAEVNLDIDRVTQKRFVIPITVFSPPDSMAVELSTTEVEIVARLPLSRAAAISPSDFVAAIDLSATQAPGETVPLRLTTVPDGAIILRQSVKFVDVKLDKPKG